MPPAPGPASIAVLHAQVDGAAGSARPLLPLCARRPRPRLRLLGARPCPSAPAGPLAAPAWYPGCLSPHDAGEPGAKGALVVEIDAAGRAEVEFVPLAPVRFERRAPRRRPRLRPRRPRRRGDGRPGGDAARRRRRGAVVRLELRGRSPLALALRDPEERSDAAEELALALGALSAELRCEHLRPPLDLERHRGQPHLLGAALELAGRAASDEALLDELAPPCSRARTPAIRRRGARTSPACSARSTRRSPRRSWPRRHREDRPPARRRLRPARRARAGGPRRARSAGRLRPQRGRQVEPALVRRLDALRLLARGARGPSGDARRRARPRRARARARPAGRPCASSVTCGRGPPGARGAARRRRSSRTGPLAEVAWLERGTYLALHAFDADELRGLDAATWREIEQRLLGGASPCVPAAGRACRAGPLGRRGRTLAGGSPRQAALGRAVRAPGSARARRAATRSPGRRPTTRRPRSSHACAASSHARAASEAALDGRRDLHDRHAPALRAWQELERLRAEAEALVPEALAARVGAQPGERLDGLRGELDERRRELADLRTELERRSSPRSSASASGRCSSTPRRSGRRRSRGRATRATATSWRRARARREPGGAQRRSRAARARPSAPRGDAGRARDRADRRPAGRRPAAASARCRPRARGRARAGRRGRRRRRARLQRSPSSPSRSRASAPRSRRPPRSLRSRRRFGSRRARAPARCALPSRSARPAWRDLVTALGDLRVAESRIAHPDHTLVSDIEQLRAVTREHVLATQRLAQLEEAERRAAERGATLAACSAPTTRSVSRRSSRPPSGAMRRPRRGRARPELEPRATARPSERGRGERLAELERLVRSASPVGDEADGLERLHAAASSRVAADQRERSLVEGVPDSMRCSRRRASARRAASTCCSPTTTSHARRRLLREARARAEELMLREQHLSAGRRLAAARTVGDVEGELRASRSSSRPRGASATGWRWRRVVRRAEREVRGATPRPGCRPRAATSRPSRTGATPASRSSRRPPASRCSRSRAPVSRCRCASARRSRAALSSRSTSPCGSRSSMRSTPRRGCRSSSTSSSRTGTRSGSMPWCACSARSRGARSWSPPAMPRSPTGSSARAARAWSSSRGPTVAVRRPLRRLTVATAAPEQEGPTLLDLLEG